MIYTSATVALFAHVTGSPRKALSMARPALLVQASLVAFSAIVTVSAAAQSGRVIYHLNCGGCHPVPEDTTAVPGGRPAGEFAQLAQGRQFFMRLPPADGRSLPTEEDARLVEEVLNWKKACPVLLQSAPVVGLRPNAADRAKKQGTYAN